MIVFFVDISGIVDHHFLFITKQFCISSVVPGFTIFVCFTIVLILLFFYFRVITREALFWLWEWVIRFYCRVITREALFWLWEWVIRFYCRVITREALFWLWEWVIRFYCRVITREALFWLWEWVIRFYCRVITREALLWLWEWVIRFYFRVITRDAPFCLWYSSGYYCDILLYHILISCGIVYICTLCVLLSLFCLDRYKLLSFLYYFSC